MATLRIVSMGLGGSSEDQTYPVRDDCPLSIGRSPDNEIQLLDTQVSRHLVLQLRRMPKAAADVADLGEATKPVPAAGGQNRFLLALPRPTSSFCECKTC